MAQVATPIRFGAATGRDLFAVHHAPATVASGRAVLMLNPFGQEAVRAHRLLRVLADRLSRKGLHVLRFDFYGTGDSGGDDLDGDLDGWCGDAAAAHRLLADRSGCEDVAWLGIRLGFTLGAMAAIALAAASGPRPGRLVGWDPVTDGAAYLRELSASHAIALRRAYSLPTVPDAEVRRLGRLVDPEEAIGFGLSDALVRQLRGLDRTRLAPLRCPVAVIRSRRAPAFLPASPDGSAIVEAIDVDFDWTSEEALSTPLVPDAALKRLVALLVGDPAARTAR